MLLALLYKQCGGNAPAYSWKEHYLSDSKDPYGTFLVRNLLETYFPGENFVVLKDSLNERLDTGSFVYIGDQFWVDSAAMSQLLGFASRGNQVFIACPYLPQMLFDTLGGQICVNDTMYDDESTVFDGDLYQLTDTIVTANFEHPSLADENGYKLQRRFLNTLQNYEWSYMPEEYFCEGTSLTPLGKLNGEHTNFLRIPFGKGEFLLNTTPIAFTNIHLLDKHGLDYTAKVFSHLKKGKILWDERPYDPFAEYAGEGGGGSRMDKESPLKYILKQPSLAWAWYVLLGMAVTYVIFRAKRRQRVIPVLEKNVNTSLEFIGTIGRLFFLQNNHRQLAAQKMRLFLIFVHERYHLPTKDLNDQFAKGLAIRSDVPEAHIQKILNLNRNISNSGHLSSDTLVDFHRLMEKFYRECR